MFTIAKAYNNITNIYINVIIVINILTTIICYFIKDFNDDTYFIAKIYNKIIIKGAMIAESFYNDIISFSYSRIKFIILFKYLTLY